MPYLIPAPAQRLAGSRRHGLARLWAWGLLLALLVAPLLGVLHMVAHPPAAHPVAAGTVAAGGGSAHALSAHAAAEPARIVAYSWLDRLFGHQAGGGDCRLFDQLCQGQALPSVPVLPAVLLPPAAVFVFLLLGRIVQREALFHARAPPTLR